MRKLEVVTLAAVLMCVALAGRWLRPPSEAPSHAVAIPFRLDRELTTLTWSHRFLAGVVYSLRISPSVPSTRTVWIQTAFGPVGRSALEKTSRCEPSEYAALLEKIQRLDIAGPRFESRQNVHLVLESGERTVAFDFPDDELNMSCATGLTDELRAERSNRDNPELVAAVYGFLNAHGHLAKASPICEVDVRLAEENEWKRKAAAREGCIHPH